MNIGLIGLAKSGKTTIFNALTGEQAETSAFSTGRVQPNRAMVQVEDTRVGDLAELYNPKKTIYAQIEIVDFAGLVKDGSDGQTFTGEALGAVKTTDALAIVLRNFDNGDVTAQHGSPGPMRDLEAISTELLLADQILVEKRLERIHDDRKRGKKHPEYANEEKILSALLDRLEAGVPVRQISLTPEQRKALSGYQFLTDKALFAVLNSDETCFGNSQDIIDEIAKACPVVEFSGRFEMELSHLEPGEAVAFMEDMGITESARSRLTTSAYEILGYISFFTVGEDEVRAWTVRSGGSAVDAAGTIHSDLARGFIRAECFTYDDLSTHGTERALREKGLLRLEGKAYEVKDGDILNVRFSV